MVPVPVGEGGVEERVGRVGGSHECGQRTPYLAAAWRHRHRGLGEATCHLVEIKRTIYKNKNKNNLKKAQEIEAIYYFTKYKIIIIIRNKSNPIIDRERTQTSSARIAMGTLTTTNTTADMAAESPSILRHAGVCDVSVERWKKNTHVRAWLAKNQQK
jgi:hypothetical protein